MNRTREIQKGRREQAIRALGAQGESSETRELLNLYEKSKPAQEKRSQSHQLSKKDESVEAAKTARLQVQTLAKIANIHAIIALGEYAVETGTRGSFRIPSRRHGNEPPRPVDPTTGAPYTPEEINEYIVRLNNNRTVPYERLLPPPLSKWLNALQIYDQQRDIGPAGVKGGRRTSRRTSRRASRRTTRRRPRRTLRRTSRRRPRRISRRTSRRTTRRNRPIQGGKFTDAVRRVLGIRTPNKRLIRAAQYGNVQEVKKILGEAGVNIETRDKKSGNTALMFAALGNWYDVVRLLLDKGANTEAMNKDGETALDIAENKENLKIMVALLDFNAIPRTPFQKDYQVRVLREKKKHQKMVESGMLEEVILHRLPEGSNTRKARHLIRESLGREGENERLRRTAKATDVCSVCGQEASMHDGFAFSGDIRVDHPFVQKKRSVNGEAGKG